MVAADGVHLIDFGAVKVGRVDTTSMTTVGTFGFMAPEQILGRADTRSDLYGLGMSFVALATGLEPSELPQDPSTGQIDARSALKLDGALQRVILALIRPGLDERPASAKAALELLDHRELPAKAQPPTRSSARNLPRINPIESRLSPYKHPQALTEQDRADLRQHALERFPSGLAVLLQFMTFGLFSLIHYGLTHDKLPKALHNDPSGGKAVGFSFIPYFNFYWCIFNPLRLADRLNLQSRLRDRGDRVPRGYIMACGILSVIPYINMLVAIPMWGAGVYLLQQAINELADEAEAERLALGPGADGDEPAA